MITSLTFVIGSASFTVSFLAHLILWRVYRPRRELNWLVCIFFLLPIVCYLGLLFILPQVKGSLIVGWPSIFYISLWHILLSLVYLLSYPAVQSPCPSLKIILLISKVMPSGLSFAELNESFSHGQLYGDSFSNLKDDGMLYIENDRYHISHKGRWLVIFFTVYRKLFGLPEGEG
jgi:hypothetical protein